MAYDIDILMDFISSLALVALLAIAYSAFLRRFQGPNLAPIFLGFLFGIVTIIQMHTPLSPMEGLIVDMRNVPIALAGAFLGLRGLAACLIIAMGTRYGIGGVGWISGLLGMVIAGCAGFAWNHLTRHRETRGPALLFGLGAAMCSHLIAVAVLPADIAVWFRTVAAPVVVVLNLLSVPLVGALFERERQLMISETRMQAAATADPETGLLTQAAFAREVSLAGSAGSDAGISGILKVEFRNRKWLTTHLGAQQVAQLSGALRHRLKAQVTHGDLLGQSDDGAILVPLSDTEILRVPEIETALRRDLSECAIVLPNRDMARPVVDCGWRKLTGARDVGSILAQLCRKPRPPRAETRAAPSARRDQKQHRRTCTSTSLPNPSTCCARSTGNGTARRELRDRMSATVPRRQLSNRIAIAR